MKGNVLLFYGKSLLKYISLTVNQIFFSHNLKLFSIFYAYTPLLKFIYAVKYLYIFATLQKFPICLFFVSKKDVSLWVLFCKSMLMRFPMAETPWHSDIVMDTENGLQTVFILKNFLQPLGIFPLRHCTQAWKFSAFKQKFPLLKTVFVVSEVNIDPVRNRIQKFLNGRVYRFRPASPSLLLHISTISRELINRINDNTSCLPSFK